MKYLFAILFILVTIQSFSQLTVQSGTNVNILSGTTIELISDTLHIEDSTTINNDGVVILSDSSFINEANGYPISGSGYEIISKQINNTLTGSNIGGLGLQLFNNTNVDSMIIKRSHQDIYNTAVLRNFELPLGYTDLDSLIFIYDTTELNGLDNNLLKLYNYRDTNNGVWFNHGGALINNQLQLGNADSLIRFTLAETQMSFINYPLIICQGDTLNITFEALGLFNDNNKFYLELSDENGVFGPTSNYIDSLQATNGTHNFIFEMPSVSTNSSNYILRLMCSEPKLLGDTSQAITINNLPDVQILNAPDTLCLNLEATLQSNQIGGIFSGTGISNGAVFNASMAQVGLHDVIYNFSNNNGCNNSDTVQIEVIGLPSVTLSSPVNEVCINGVPFNLTPQPLNGTYTHNAVTNNEFDPSLSTPGLQNVGYTLTDIYGCKDTAFVNIEVFDLTPLTIDGLNSEYCLNDLPSTLTPTPLGGSLSGDGIVFVNQFDPQIADVGTHNIQYVHTDNNNCQNEIIETVVVYPLPDTALISQNGNLLAASNALNYQWYLNGNEIPGATNQFFYAQESGFYSVETINAYGCSVMSDIFNFEYSSLLDNKSLNKIYLYPNPGRDVFEINGLLSNKKYEISVLSSDGKLTYKRNIENNTNVSVNVSSLQKGLYMIKIKDYASQNTKNFRWIKH